LKRIMNLKSVVLDHGRKDKVINYLTDLLKSSGELAEDIYSRQYYIYLGQQKC
jgi:hypothetical protein